jgi:hypothetical protein
VPGYAALYALAINFLVSLALTPVLNLIPMTRGSDRTRPSDYHFDSQTGAEPLAPAASVRVAVD